MYGISMADPGAAGGIDLDSDTITELAEECPNLAGVKLTYVVYDMTTQSLNVYSIVGAAMSAS